MNATTLPQQAVFVSGSTLRHVAVMTGTASVGLIAIFVLVGVAGYRLRRETGARAWLILVGVAVTLVVLAFFAVDTVRNAPQTFAAIVVVGALAVVFDLVWKRARGPLPEDVPAAPSTSSA